MQIKFGEKLKSLRGRDGRRQEDLAAALCVSNQAVSRWETGGGYPDMEMIPAIANYFHVTIDELFGYDGDREARLRDYIAKADEMTIKDPAAAAALLREALTEFPAAWELQIELAAALTILADRQRSDGKEPDDEALGAYRKEAVTLYEAVVKSTPDANARASALVSLVSLYSEMGEWKMAERTALLQMPLRSCRELLLPLATKGEKRERYAGEAILQLLSGLRWTIEDAVMQNPDLAAAPAGLEPILALERLYGAVFPDGNYGSLHSDLCMLNLRCAGIAAKCREQERAMAYVEKALLHFEKFEETNRRGEAVTSSLLVKKATRRNIPVVMLTPEIFKTWASSLPETLAEKLRSEPRLAGMFAG